MAQINKEQFTKQLGKFIRTKRERMNLTLEDVAQCTGVNAKLEWTVTAIVGIETVPCSFDEGTCFYKLNRLTYVFNCQTRG